MQKVLIPLDGSALAETVIPHAQALARLSDSIVLLLHVVTPSETSQTRFWSAAAPADLRRQWEADALTRIHSYLAALARRLQTEGLQVQTEVLANHDPAAAIVTRAECDPAIGLIAMATHGRSGMGRWVLGSVATKVLQAVSKPLLLVHACEGARASISQANYRTILVPLDGSPFAEHALGQAQIIAAGAKAELLLVSVVPVLDEIGLAEAGVVPYWMVAEEQAAQVEATRYLAQLAERLTTEGLTVRTRLLTGAPAEAILGVSVEEHADLIVMTTHGRSGLSRLWLGSVAARVVQSADLPVLLIRAQVQQEDARREHGALSADRRLV